MKKIITIIGNAFSIMKKREVFPLKNKLLSINYNNNELENIIIHIVNGEIEDAIGLYSTVYEDTPKLNENLPFCEIISNEGVVNKISKHKKRYFEFFSSFFNCENDVLEISFYKEHKDKIKHIQNKLLFNPQNRNFFKNRIEEWKVIFDKKTVPYITKSILYKEINKFSVKTDEKLFKGLISITPLYFLRKMQLPNMFEFIDLTNALNHFEKGKRLKMLDYGCGSADLSLYCAMNNHEVTICDLKGGNLDAAKKRFDLRGIPVKTIEVTYENSVPEINEKFDLIIALEVIEHVRLPHKLLSQFNESINKNGIIMLGSFPFKGTSATGDHLIEAVSQKKELLYYINSNWNRFEQEGSGNTFVKELSY